MKKFFILHILLITANCAANGGANRLKQQFLAIGLSPDRTTCLVEELDDRLDQQDIREISSFLDDINRSNSAGETLDALLSIDNPDVATAIAKSGISCAFSTLN